MSDGVARAVVRCRDGRDRVFVAQLYGECMTFNGKKWDYILLDDMEGKGIQVHRVEWVEGERTYPVAKNKMQPVWMRVRTANGAWSWYSESHRELKHDAKENSCESACCEKQCEA